MDKGPLPEPARRFRLGDLEIDLERESVRRDAEMLELPELSFRLLAALLRRAPERVDKDELIRAVWDEVVVSDETLAQRVRLLRQALGDDGQSPRYVAAVRGRGYRVISPVETLDSPVREASASKWWPALAGVALVLVAGIWLVSTRAPEQLPSPAVTSIAVLPFADLSPALDHGHFADGMQEELLTRLTKLDSVDVLSRTSVEKFRGTSLDIREIARETGVTAVIEGSVRIDEEQVRITVQLIDAATDRHIWAEAFDRELSVANIFSIQEEVADQIATSLQLEYTAVPASATVTLPTSNIDAYDAFLLGRYHTFRQTSDDLELAVTYLEQATALDADFAEAWASLGWAYSFLGAAYGRRPPSEVYPKARAAALRALALDNGLADAHSLYADILTWYDWDFTAAEREYVRTLEIDPVNVLGYALFLSTQLRHAEAIALVDMRVAADPDDPYVHVNAAWRYLNAGQLDRAIDAAARASGHPDAISVLGLSHLGEGNIDRAVELFESGLARQGRTPTQLSNLATAYFKAGRSEDGQALLDELEARAGEAYVSPALIAAVYFAAGDPDEGFALLDQAVSARAREVIFVQVSQMLGGHRDDPRYEALIRAVGFE